MERSRAPGAPLAPYEPLSEGLDMEGLPRSTVVVVEPPMPPDHFVWSLCTMLYGNICCLGFMALVFSVKVEGGTGEGAGGLQEGGGSLGNGVGVGLGTPTETPTPGRPMDPIEPPVSGNAVDPTELPPWGAPWRPQKPQAQENTWTSQSLQPWGAS